MSWVSLGFNCAVTYQIKKHNLRSEAYPFDWASFSLNSLIKILSTKFENFDNVELKGFSQCHKLLDSNNGSYILTNPYSITFAHEVSNQETLDTFKNSLKRRIERFLNLSNPIFVRLETANLTDVQIKNYDVLVRILDKMFSSYQLIVISTKNPNNSKIKWIKLENFESDWKYPSVDWASVFNLNLEN